MKARTTITVTWEGCGTEDFRVLATWKERLRGLLGTSPDARPVVLVNCRSIHTFGMRYALDVALVDANGRVLVSKRSVPPCRLVRSYGARHAFERPASKNPWPEVGQCMRRG